MTDQMVSRLGQDVSVDSIYVYNLPRELTIIIPSWIFGVLKEMGLILIIKAPGQFILINSTLATYTEKILKTQQPRDLQPDFI